MDTSEASVTSLHWFNGTDETNRGWWFTCQGQLDLLVGPLESDADPDDVMRAIRVQLRRR